MKALNLPNGLYTGIWGGYLIKFTYNGTNYELGTEDGIRGFNVNVIIESNDDELTFEEAKN